MFYSAIRDDEMFFTTQYFPLKERGMQRYIDVTSASADMQLVNLRIRGEYLSGASWLGYTDFVLKLTTQKYTKYDKERAMQAL